MYLRKIHIQNLKLIRDLKLDFVGADGEPRMWTVVLAENGMCKTALLQAIALVASGQDRSNQLANIDSLPDRRLPGKQDVKIAAEFGFSDRYHHVRDYPGLPPNTLQAPKLHAELQLRGGWRVFRSSSHYEGFDSGANKDPLTEASARELPLWFCAAYGVSRMLPLPSEMADNNDLQVMRMQSLFGRGPILGTNFADYFMPDDTRAFAALLQTIVSANPRLLPRLSDLSLQGRGGVNSASRLVESHRIDFQVTANQFVRLPATWLSHGYQSTLAWIADVVGHIMWEAEHTKIMPAEMEGIILIDELDAHLHPLWQMTLIEGLKMVFPRLQFIATTHSPLLLGGLAEDEIVRLRQDEDGSITAAAIPAGTPALMTGSELYDTYFGVSRPAYSLKLQRYALLAEDPLRSQADDLEVAQLRQELHKAGIDPGITEIEREVAQ